MEKINLCVSIDRNVVDTIRNLAEYYGFSTSSVTNRILKLGIEQIADEPIFGHNKLTEDLDNA